MKEATKIETYLTGVRKLLWKIYRLNITNDQLELRYGDILDECRQQAKNYSEAAKLVVLNTFEFPDHGRQIQKLSKRNDKLARKLEKLQEEIKNRDSRSYLKRCFDAIFRNR